MNGRQNVTHIVCTNQIVGKNLWMMDFVRKPCVETVLRYTSTITGLNIQRFETRKFSMIIEKWSLKKSIAMWKWPTGLREKDWMCVKALIRLETFSEPLVWEVMPLAAGRWKHLRDQRVDSASFFSSFSVGSGGYHPTSTIAPQANKKF